MPETYVSIQNTFLLLPRLRFDIFSDISSRDPFAVEAQHTAFVLLLNGLAFERLHVRINLAMLRSFMVFYRALECSLREPKRKEKKTRQDSAHVPTAQEDKKTFPIPKSAKEKLEIYDINYLKRCSTSNLWFGFFSSPNIKRGEKVLMGNFGRGEGVDGGDSLKS